MTAGRGDGERFGIGLVRDARRHRIGLVRTRVSVQFRDVDELLATLAAGADVGDDESVDVLTHSLQCCALLAGVEPGDRELQVAGLVHDVGTVLQPRHPRTHARLGAAAVRDLLGARVARLVELHDQAKRYLVTTDPAYRHQLSARSVETLRLQGGLLDPVERATLDADPDLPAALALRRADDAAKVPGVVVPPLSHWRGLVDRLARSAA